MDVPSPVSGVVTELKVKVGDKIAEGTLVALVKVAAAGRRAPAPAAHAAAAGGCSTRRRCRPPCRQRRLLPRAAGKLRRQGRPRMRNAGAGRRPRRLLRRLPRRRPRHEDRDRRALCDAGRRLPQCRLHSLQGAAACRRGDGRSRHMPATSASASPRPRSTSTSCARTRKRWSASSPAAWPAWPRRARWRPCAATAISSTPTTSKSRRPRDRAQDKTGAKKVIRFQKCIIAAGSAAFHLPFIPKDPRIVDSTGALELRFVPQGCW
jgi:dihydrolipoamide dehydrogenase